ncbi:probable DNA polymerase IV at N-terminal half [Coccomyxa sp. Obi]|nr:probable DNA polymerase IV at N-terminal half [Coccomyxa sp. Obi]
MAHGETTPVTKSAPSTSTGGAAQKSEEAANWQQWSGTVFTNAKAGMAGVDKDKIKAVVYEMSKDSPHFKNEERKQSQTMERIRKMQDRAKVLSTSEIAGHTRAMDAKLAKLKAEMDLTRTWMHVDMDAFFAAVEELDEPSLKGKPMAVGGIGMICTANYAARKFGVRSAMPGFIGRRLCPELVFVKPNFQKYTRAAAATRAIFAQYDPEFEAGSLDEAYLDLRGFCPGTGEAVAEEIRRRVREETRLTCSCGIGPNRLLAKVATDMRKPDGQYAIPGEHSAISRFVDPLPIRKVPGIGKVSEQVLSALGVEVCADLVTKRGLLAALFSPISADFFMEVGLGVGRTQHSAPVEDGAVGRKGISVERTFSALSSPADLEAKCSELAEKLAEDVESEGLKGRTVTLKLKTTTFEVRTRAATLARHISGYDDIFREALKLLRPELPITIRLMGIRLSGFLETNTEPGQRTLSAFLKPDTAAAAVSPPKRRNWNQTFMPREVRECIDQEMEKYQASHPSKEAEPLDHLHAAPSAPSQEQDEQLQLADAANCNTVQNSVVDAIQQQPSQCGVVRLQADAQQGNGGPSQHLELSLRHWAPPTASQVLAVSQQQSDQEPAGADSSADRHPAQSENVGGVSRDVGSSQGDVDPCRDILDTPAPDEVAGADLAHAWDEAPSGLGDAHDIHAPDGPGSCAPAPSSAPKHWTCQVCTYSGNHPRILRCDICDSVRGTRWDYYLGQSAEATSGSQHPVPARDSPAARETSSGQSWGSSVRLTGRALQLLASSSHQEVWQAPHIRVLLKGEVKIEVGRVRRRLSSRVAGMQQTAVCNGSAVLMAVGDAVNVAPALVMRPEQSMKTTT